MSQLDNMRIWLGICSIALLPASARAADITVGFVTSLSGNASSIGVPYSKGIAAAREYKKEIGGHKVRFIQLDDASDPSTATRNARKLVEDDKVDVLIGTATAVSTIAMTAVAVELKVPMIAIAPLSEKPVPSDKQWSVTVVPPPSVMVKVVTDKIRKDGKTDVGYIGFSDSWGDFVFDGAKAAEARGDIKVVANERYARSDTSVTGQILKLLAAKPSSVLIGGAGTQGALPMLSLAERNYKGAVYGTVALANADFVRVGGKAVEGIQVGAAPAVVAGQLPDGHYAKKLSLAFRDAYEKANGSTTKDGFSVSAFDAWLVVDDAAKRVDKTLNPGTAEYRKALNDAILTTHELPGVSGVYTFKPGKYAGSDERAQVMVRLVNGAWIYSP
jgi:branched-chain amino acid transport system substrate-binding protein